MKRKEFQEHKNKSISDLKKDLSANREKLVGLKFDLAAGKIKNISEIKQIKKSIAQILTIVREKETQ
ncbi:MAG: 50S ribosomal protein L29 [Patescibacteria group bacterium]